MDGRELVDYRSAMCYTTPVFETDWGFSPGPTKDYVTSGLSFLLYKMNGLDEIIS